MKTEINLISRKVSKLSINPSIHQSICHCIVLWGNQGKYPITFNQQIEIDSCNQLELPCGRRERERQGIRHDERRPSCCLQKRVTLSATHTQTKPRVCGYLSVSMCAGSVLCECVCPVCALVCLLGPHPPHLVASFRRSRGIRFACDKKGSLVKGI